jgi:hypothetical protein
LQLPRLHGFLKMTLSRALRGGPGGNRTRVQTSPTQHHTTIDRGSMLANGTVAFSQVLCRVPGPVPVCTRASIYGHWYCYRSVRDALHTYVFNARFTPGLTRSDPKDVTKIGALTIPPPGPPETTNAISAPIFVTSFVTQPEQEANPRLAISASSNCAKLGVDADGVAHNLRLAQAALQRMLSVACHIHTIARRTMGATRVSR